jgi:hypothetical protein
VKSSASVGLSKATSHNVQIIATTTS